LYIGFNHKLFCVIGTLHTRYAIFASSWKIFSKKRKTNATSFFFVMSRSNKNATPPGPAYPIYVGTGSVVTISIAISIPEAIGEAPLQVQIGSVEDVGVDGPIATSLDRPYHELTGDWDEDESSRIYVDGFGDRLSVPADLDVPPNDEFLMGVPGCSYGSLPGSYSDVVFRERVTSEESQSNADVEFGSGSLSGDGDLPTDDELDFEVGFENVVDYDSDVEIIDDFLEADLPDLEVVWEYIVVD
jgi:hypothetical protein